MSSFEDDVKEERLAQSVLRFCAGTPRTIEELASHLETDPLETRVLLRRMGPRVVDVTSFDDRQKTRQVWLAAEAPLRGLTENS